MLGLSVYHGSGKVRAIQDKYVLDFPANADTNFSLVHITKPVRIKTIRLVTGLGSFASYVVKKNSVVTALPFDVALNDHVLVELTGWNNTHVQFEISGEPIAETRSLYAPDLGGDGRYLFVMNFVDQSVSVIDTGITAGVHPNETHPTTNVPLPAGGQYRCLVYRAIDQSVYVFGSSRVSRIDANPASATFKTVVQTSPCAIQSYTCCYDYNRDNFYIGARPGNNVYRVNPATLSSVNLSFSTGLGLGRTGAIDYFPQLEGVYIGDETSGQIILRTEDDTPAYGFGSVVCGRMIYNSLDGKFYHNLDGNIGRRSLNPIKLIQSVVNDYFRRGDIALVPNLGLCFAGNLFANHIGVVNINGATMISQGWVIKGNPATNEIATRCILFSPYSQRVYAQASNSGNQIIGVNRVHIVNPSLVVADMYAGYCDVGNMDATNGNQPGLSQMCFNQLQL